MYQGKCQGCDAYGEVDDIMLCDECADDLEKGVDWDEYKKERTEKRWRNRDWSLDYLKQQGIEFETLNESVGHYRVKGISFWPTTGKFYDPKTGKKGRGVKEFVELIKKIS